MNQKLPERPNGDDRKGAISRRVFLGAAGGSLVVIPAAAGGFLITPQFVGAAYADDAPTAAQTTVGETRLIIAKSNEVGVTVYDMTQNARKPIADAKVTITSHATKKTVAVTTDSKGVAMIDIVDLSEKAGKKEVPPKYEFDGIIEVSKNGFRVFRTGRIHFSGAKGLPVPTRVVDSGIPYPALVSFDDWDVLYTRNEFAVAKGNVVKHTIAIEFENVGSDDISVSLHSSDAKQLVAGTVKPSGGKAKVTFQKLFLRAEHRESLPAGEGFYIEYTYKGLTYQCPIALVISKAVPGGDSAQVKSGMTLSPFDTGSMLPGITIKFPKDWWVIGGMSFKPYIPEFKNVEYSFNPFGYFRVAFKTGEYGNSWKDKEGQRKSDGWMYHPRKTFEENQGKANQDSIDTFDKTWDKLTKGDKFFQSAELVQSFSAGVSGQIQVAGQWDDPSNLLRGQLQASAILSIAYSLGWQFLIGYVPLFLEIKVNASFTLGFGAAFATPSVFSPSKYVWDYTSSGLDFTMTIVPSITLALGVRGVIAAGGKVKATFTVYVGILSPKQLPEGAEKNGISYPHVVGGFSWSISIYLMLFGHTWTPKSWSPQKWPEAFDSWKGGWQPPFDSWNNNLSAQSDEFDFSSLLEGAEMITNDSLSEVAEFGVKPGASLSAQSDSGDQKQLRFETETEVVKAVMDDGTTCRYRVLTPVEKRDAGSLRATAISNGSSGAGLVAASLVEELTDRAEPTSDISLTAQAEDDAPNMVTIGDHKYNFTVPAPEIKALASDQGLVPKSDIKLAEKVMCDSRMKMVTICGMPFAFRIASGQVAPVYTESNKITPDHYDPRLRVTGFCLADKDVDLWKPWVFREASKSRGPSLYDDAGNLINFDDLYDYDFAVYAEPETVERQNNVTGLSITHRSIVHLFIISGFREKGDNTSIEDVVCDQMLTYCRYEFRYVEGDTTFAIGGRYGANLLACRTITAKDYDKEHALLPTDLAYKHHMFSCPHISVIQDQNGTESRKVAVMTFLDRATDKDDKKFVLSTNKFDVDISLGTMFFVSPDDNYEREVGEVAPDGTLVIPYMNDIRPKMGPIEDHSVYELTCTERMDNGWHILMMRGNAYSHYFAMRTVAGYGDSTPQIADIKYLEPREDRLRLVYWKGHGGFLASVGGEKPEGIETDSGEATENAKLQYVTITGYENNGALQLTFEDIGPTNFNVKGFDVDPTGRFIYYPSSQCGNADGDYSDTKHDMGDDVEAYRIMACKFLGNRFSEPFVFAEVSHSMDTLYSYNDGTSAIAFASTEVTNAKLGQGNLWYTSMPHVRSATLIQCTSLTAYAYPEEMALFEVAVRNDGNTHLSGFTANLFEKGQKSAASSARVVFSKDTLVESNWNPANDDGSLKNVGPDYLLAPGATSVYRIAMPIPSGWSGTKTIVITASDAIAGEVGGSSIRTNALRPMAEDDYDEWYVDYTAVQDYPDEEVYIPSGYEVSSEDLEDAPITIKKPSDDDPDDNGGGSDDPDDNGGGSGNGGGNGGNGDGTTTPSTGDPFSALGLATAAVAAAGAAFAAYSKRRAAIERGEEPDDLIDVEGNDLGN